LKPKPGPGDAFQVKKWFQPRVKVNWPKFVVGS